MNELNNPRLNGFILTGGKSKRMGTDKALLIIDDEPLLKRMIRFIDPFCQQVIISGSKTIYRDFQVEMIPDLYTDCGPIAGIFSSLTYSTLHWNLIVSVDVPFVNQELFELMISCIDDFDCIIPKHQSGIEPLVGLYHKKVIPVVEKMISSGEYKLMNLLSKLNVRFVDCNLLIEKYPRLFVNINRMEDYRAI